jgi:transcription antitermination factor NusG
MSDARVYVAVTAQGCEKRAMQALLDGGIAAFTPLERRWRYAAGRRRPHERPVPGFARLVFVATRDIEADLPKVLACRYVDGVLGASEDDATPIDAPVMGCRLGVGSSRTSLDWLFCYIVCSMFGLFDHTRGPLAMRVGQRVKIIGGPFKGLGYEGKVAELRDGGRLVVVRKSGGRMNVRAEQVEAVKDEAA